MCRDEGDSPEEESKTEDSEPLPVIPDSWARGLVPVATSSPPSHPFLQQVLFLLQITCSVLTQEIF